ncbi:uncharacterized protein LOC131934658 isoform X3 [Physella acuta]|uniref:uncharacterized protein LOC131934658 isoform X3 n=1 Tax=Physella acuta TaxID=109671 RepID=UPI0027DBB45A|nr:uncharacterized protein LOC131934658 isoform X3 [Physella acuta]
MSSQVVNDFYNTRKSASHKRKAVDDNPYDADVKPKKVAYIESLNNNKAKMKDVSNQENENEKILHSMLLTCWLIHTLTGETSIAILLQYVE